MFDVSEGKTAPFLLSSVRVRPVATEDKKRWCAVMDEHHYLGFCKAAGERIFYVAEVDDGRWVAILSWAAAALHVGCRERWLGWDDVARKKRLRFVANNTRFLILPNINVKNLASRVLSLNIQRLSKDWVEFYGHPIWLAETFVDPERYRGTCYKAAGWQEIGKTAGFTRLPVESGFYESNGKPKIYFAKPLVPKVCEKFSSSIFVENNREYFAMDVSKLPIEGKGGLFETLKTISDPRQKQGMRHSCISIMAISTCAMLSGARGYKAIAEWAKGLTPSQLKKLRSQKAPSTSPIKLVLQNLDPTEFDEKISGWLTRSQGQL